MLRWLGEKTLSVVIMKVADGVIGRVATVAVRSLPPVAEATDTVSNERLEFIELHAF